MTAVIGGAGCGAHASPTNQAFWGKAYEQANTNVESPRQEFPPVQINLPLTTYALENGLKVIQHEDHRVPLVTLLIEYDAGRFDDPKGKGGLAHLTEHLMFRGSRDVPDGAFFRTLQQNGAIGINATTREEGTRYFETLPSHQLELALWLESDRLAFPFEIDAAKFSTEKEVVKNELRDVENRPYSGVFERIRRVLYPAGHPIHEMPTRRETLAAIDAIELVDVRRFFREHYGPNHATMVLAGDFTTAKAKRIVERYFAAVPPGPPPARRPAYGPVVLDHQEMLRIEADVAAPGLVICWPTGPEFGPDDAALDVIAALFERPQQLSWKLMTDAKVASTFGAHQSSRRWGSFFAIEATLRSPDQFAKALGIIDEALDDVRALRTGFEAVRASKSEWAMKLLLRSESLAGRGSSFLSYARQTDDPAFLPRDLARYAAITATALQRAAGLLQRNNRVVATVVPTTGAPASGEAP
jgi:zinc protease